MREGHCWDPWNMLAKRRTSPFDWKSHCQASQGQTITTEPSLSQSTLLNHGISITSPWKTSREMKDTGLIATSFCNLNKQLRKSNSLSGMKFIYPLPTRHRHLDITQPHAYPVRRIWSSSAQQHDSLYFALSKEELSKQPNWFKVVFQGKRGNIRGWKRAANETAVL